MAYELEPVLAEVERGFRDSVTRLCDFLRIPSVSTDPKYNADVRRCADWISGEFRKLGFNSDVHPTQGHPMVVASQDGPPGYDGPRILYYGHYDVQPPDPLDLWESPPFEPVIRKGAHGERVVARGAVDDKGQVMTFVECFRAWHAVHGGPPCPVTVFLEGEEESGSKSLVPFLESHKKELSADVCVVSDTGMWDIETPAITAMLRGLVYAEVFLRGPSHDLHSGMYGGALRNPINALASIISQLHDDKGRIQLKGFYDRVVPLPPRLAALWKALPFDERAFLGTAGVTEPWGEAGTTTLERTWSRPTCDCNGIIGGYTGPGGKTVIPAEASCKLSCRLVANQDPQAVFNSLKEFFESRCPKGYTVEVHYHSGSPAISVPIDSPMLAAALRGLGRVFKKAPAIIGTGGSIPAVGEFRRVLGVDSLMVGFGLDDDRVHSPNEKFELTCLRNGIRSHAAMLSEFSLLRR